jgi:hypothetical protein
VARARAWRVGEVVAVSFRRSAQLLDASIPPQVMDALTGSRVWEQIVRGSERLSPPIARPTSRRFQARLCAPPGAACTPA